MSANVIPMPTPRPPLFAHPAGVDLVPDPELVGAAAYALASLAGEDWNRMTPTRLQEYREWATFAATCAQPEGLRLAAYSMGRMTEFQFIDAPTILRKSMVDRLMGAIRGACLRVSGVCNRDAHAKLLDLIEQDCAQGRW